MNERLLIVAGAFLVAVAAWAAWASGPDRAAAAVAPGGSIGVPAALPQAQEARDQDDRVPVQVWTMVAAAGAALVGLAAFAIRWKLGRVAPPPEQGEQTGEH
jgi:hypothetical protein